MPSSAEVPIIDEMPEPVRPHLGSSLDALRASFLSDVHGLRPQLHRYCSRMTGSVLDGEDLVQEVLAHAFFQLPTLRDRGALKSWLFRIAHNRCVTFLRRRKPEQDLEPIDDEAGYVPTDQAELRQEMSHALEMMVGCLTPKQRACVLLKDALDLSLDEVAGIVGTTRGGVKDALHRGRAKLRAAEHDASPEPPAQENSQLLRAYVDAFNARAWDELSTLIRSDARLELVGVDDGPLGNRYLTNYAALPWRWHLALALVDGEPMMVHYRLEPGSWRPHAAIRLSLSAQKVEVIRDYVHVDYLLEHSHVHALTALPDPMP